MNASSQLTRIATLTGLILGAGVISVLAAFTSPTSVAPNGNAPGPIDTGSVAQTRTGPLQVNDRVIVAGSLVVTGGLKYSSSTPATGKILAAYDTNGTAKWSLPLGPVKAYVGYSVEWPYGGPGNATQRTQSSCPDGYILVGFDLIKTSGTPSPLATLFCRKLLY
jgi:hypothetical protein